MSGRTRNPFRGEAEVPLFSTVGIILKQEDTLLLQLLSLSEEKQALVPLFAKAAALSNFTVNPAAD